MFLYFLAQVERFEMRLKVAERSNKSQDFRRVRATVLSLVHKLGIELTLVNSTSIFNDESALLLTRIQRVRGLLLKATEQMELLPKFDLVDQKCSAILKNTSQ